MAPDRGHRAWPDPFACTITTTVTLNTTDGGRVVTQSGTGPAVLVGTTPQNQRFTFDRLDRLTKAETLNAADTVITTVERHYNDLGRLVWEKQTYAGDMRQVSYEYTLSGALDSVTYPDGSLLQYRQSDELDRPTQVWFAGALLAQLTYAGQRSSRIELYVPDTPGGPAPLTGDLGHDEYGRITGALWRGLNGEVIDRFETAYDETGNPKYERADELPASLPRPWGRHWSFGVDGVDRLREAISGSALDGNGQIMPGTSSLTQSWMLDDLSARIGMQVNTFVHSGTHNETNEMTQDVVDPW